MKVKTGDRLRLINNVCMNSHLEIGDECEVVKKIKGTIYLKFEKKLNDEYHDEYDANQWLHIPSFVEEEYVDELLEDLVDRQFELINE